MCGGLRVSATLADVRSGQSTPRDPACALRNALRSNQTLPRSLSPLPLRTSCRPAATARRLRIVARLMSIDAMDFIKPQAGRLAAGDKRIRCAGLRRLSQSRHESETALPARSGALSHRSWTRTLAGTGRVSARARRKGRSGLVIPRPPAGRCLGNRPRTRFRRIGSWP
jgi:hypothetical protein